MRTTVTLDDDVAAAVERLRSERGVGVSSVINELVRSGLVHRAGEAPAFVQVTSSGGARTDLHDVAAVLELLDGPAAR